MLSGGYVGLKQPNNLDADSLASTMGGQPRLDAPGSLHHVMGRGIKPIGLAIPPNVLARADKVIR
jgi:hypothetical protein